MAYDIIGDIHGHADELKALLGTLGYRLRGGTWQHPERTAIFVGDFIDRGPQQLETLRIVRAMIDGGYARAVMGNHELNAIAYFEPDPEHPGQHLRRRNPKNTGQHAAFLHEVTIDSPEHREWTDWFLSLPLWLDLVEFRVVHACWHPVIIAEVDTLLGGSYLTRDRMAQACKAGEANSNSYAFDGTRPNGGSQLFYGLETLLKGIEVDLPLGASFPDKDGIQRFSVRTRWWMSPPVSYFDAAIVAPAYQDRLPDTMVPPVALPGHDGGTPIFFGHYWLTGKPGPLAEAVACVDYSVANGGPLVAYQWDDARPISADKYVSSCAAVA